MHQGLALLVVAAAAAWATRLGFAWYAKRLAAQALREGSPAQATHALARAFGFVAGSTVAMAANPPGNIVPTATSVAGAASSLGVLLATWWIYRAYADQNLRLLATVRGPEWDNRFHSDLAALVQGALLGVPLAACGLALALHLAADAAGFVVPPLAAALCIYPAIPLLVFYLRRLARRMLRDPEPVPERVRFHVESALGAGASQTMAVLPTHGGAFYNAIAIDAGLLHDVWISRPLLESLEPDEAAAVLIHEQSHHDRHDGRRRLVITLAIHALVLVPAAVFGWATLPVSCLAWAIAWVIANGPVGQRHELVADARAADAGLAEAMGRALVTLHRINAVPRSADGERLATHPMLEQRLEALGVEVPEPTAEEAPLRPTRKSWLLRLASWSALVIVMVVVLTAQRRLGVGY